MKGVSPLSSRVHEIASGFIQKSTVLVPASIRRGPCAAEVEIIVMTLFTYQ